MTSSHANLRTRSVKALSLVIEQDPSETMTALMIKDAVEQRILDESVSVREAILGLIKKENGNKISNNNAAQKMWCFA